MKSLIRNILLVENRVDDVKRKYSDIDQEVIDYASQKDPSGNNKYLDWIIGRIMVSKRLTFGTKTKIDDIVKVLEDFEKYGDRLTGERVYEAIVKIKGYIPQDVTVVMGDNGEKVWYPKNINTYPSHEILNSVIDYIKTKYPSNSEIKSETDIIYNDNLLLVAVPKTLKSSCKYGSGTKWCTTSVKYPHFKQYTDGDQGLIYYIFKKRYTVVTPSSYGSEKLFKTVPKGKKLALHWKGHQRGKPSFIWFDSGDNIINGQFLLWDYMGENKTKEIDKIVDNYIKTSRGREISNPLLKWLKSFF